MARQNAEAEAAEAEAAKAAKARALGYTTEAARQSIYSPSKVGVWPPTASVVKERWRASTQSAQSAQSTQSAQPQLTGGVEGREGEEETKVLLSEKENKFPIISFFLLPTS